MKRFIIIIYLVFGFFLLNSCKDFLDIEPMDRLAENSFWKNKNDVEAVVADAYGFFFDRITDGPYHIANGDVRAGEIKGVDWMVTFNAIARNQLNDTRLIGTPERYKMLALRDWYPFYQAIASCNINIEKIPNVEALSSEDVKSYLAEMRFLRAFIYFYITRIYGDVPLYTKAYDLTPRARMPMIEVLNFCKNELKEIKMDLPWQYDDPAKWGVRAARGSVSALIANINMWLAGFDSRNANAYWEETAITVNELVQSNTFELLPIQEFKKIFNGKTKESLFEFPVNPNYGGFQTQYVTLGTWMQYSPIINNYTSSDTHFTGNYMKKIFPPSVSDKRADLWFYLPYNDDFMMMLLKFSNVSDPETWRYDDNLIIFRYADLLLLGAEALANMGRDQEAIVLVNRIRKRAGAKLYEPNDGNLIDFVFMERQRELIGEGHRWYDLVRTGRVMDIDQCANWLTSEQFKQGAWTWPIDPKARVNNPNITLNNYWN